MAASAGGLSFSSSLSLLRRGWRPILVMGLGCTVAASGWFATRPDYYEATATVLVAAPPVNQSLDPTSAAAGDPARQLENELLYARSSSLLDRLEQQVGHRPRVRVAGTSRSSDLLSFTARGDRPEQAQQAADAYAELYIAARTERMINSSARVRDTIRSKLQSLADRVESLDPADPTTPATSENLSQQIALYEQYTNGLDLLANVAGASGARLIGAAERPAAPIGPQPIRAGALALVAGLVVGFGVTVVRDVLHDTIDSRDELEAVTGFTTLALLPAVPRNASGGGLPGDPLAQSHLQEPFRSLRTAVRFAGSDAALRTLQVTSARPDEGKTTVATNLAVAMAAVGTAVVLVDADLRRPAVARRLGLSNEVGLTTVMTGECGVEAALQSVPGCSGLQVLTTGPTPGNAADFLDPGEAAVGGMPLRDVLAALTETGRRVVVDSPPVLPVADAQAICAAVSATLFVSAAGLSRRRDVRHALDSLEQANAQVIGTVLNRAGRRDACYPNDLRADTSAMPVPAALAPTPLAFSAPRATADRAGGAAQTPAADVINLRTASRRTPELTNPLTAIPIGRASGESARALQGERDVG